MELQGKIIQVLPQESGVSKSTGKEWVKAGYVLETLDQYPRNVKYDVFGEQRIKDCEVQVGDEVTVFIDIESREYNGRFYTSVTAYKVEFNLDNVQPEQQQQEHVMPEIQKPEAPSAGEDENSDLPF